MVVVQGLRAERTIFLLRVHVKERPGEQWERERVGFGHCKMHLATTTSKAASETRNRSIQSNIQETSTSFVSSQEDLERDTESEVRKNQLLIPLLLIPLLVLSFSSYADTCIGH